MSTPSNDVLPMPTPTVPNKSLTRFKSLSFDIYGTLIDWEGGILNLLTPLIDAAPADSPYKSAKTDAASRAKLMAAFNTEEHTIQSGKPSMVYDALLSEAYLALAQKIGIEFSNQVQKDAEVFGNSVGKWAAFPDTVDAMKRLGKYYKLVPLSNVDRKSFEQTRTGPLGGVPFWKWYLAEDIGSYKPDLKNFEYLLKKLDEDDRAQSGNGIRKEDDLMVAQSLFHDHVPCKQMGLASVWIARKGAGMGGTEKAKELHEEGKVGYGWRFATLGEFADEVERQWSEAGKGR